MFLCVAQNCVRAVCGGSCVMCLCMLIATRIRRVRSFSEGADVAALLLRLFSYAREACVCVCVVSNVF